MDPQQVLQQAMALHQAGRLDDADRLYRELLARTPDAYPVLHLSGLLRLQQGRLPEALALMEQALKRQPGAPDTLANYGIVLSALGRHDEALAALDQVVKARPTDAQAFSNRGGIKSKLGRPEEALADFDRAIALNSRNADALNNRGLILLGLHNYAGALDDFDRLLAVQPDRPGVLMNRAAALWRLDRIDEALESYGKELARNPDLPEALESRANLLWTRKQALAPAIADLEHLSRVAPQQPYVLGDLLHLKMHAGDWRDFSAAMARLDEAVRAGKPAAKPFVYQGLSQSPQDMLTAAVTHADLHYPALPPITRVGTRRPGPLRIGYVCGEFRAQATMVLAAGLFENHDRSRFQAFGFDNGGDDGSAMRKRVVAGFDKFIPIADLSDDAAAAAVAAEEIDILVNLNGYYGLERMPLFARKPAPIQVNYLGFPGTLGADYMDYILADATVIPPGDHRFYREKVVSLPQCYQVNDSKRTAAQATTRAAHGLPDNAFIFCHFNAGYKITPDLFAIWMRLLQQVPGSLLWLLAGDPLFEKNLAAEAARAGIDPARLVFAPPLPLAAHLSRLTLGDLFLDSFVSNAHTTASDALWAGLPLLTRLGSTFQGRVAASLLKTLDLPELIAADAMEYEAKALQLATSPDVLKNLRERLAQNRLTAPLFDTAQTTRHIEAAYEMMQATKQNGEAARSFAVPLSS